MNTYKITNISDKLGKRDDNYNITIKIPYVDEMMEKELTLKPKDTVYFRSNSLPLTVQKYRVKNLLMVSEVNDKELEKIKNNETSNSKPSNKTSTTTTTAKKTKIESKKNKSTKSKKSTSTSKKQSKTTTTTTTKKESPITSEINDDEDYNDL